MRSRKLSNGQVKASRCAFPPVASAIAARVAKAGAVSGSIARGIASPANRLAPLARGSLLAVKVDGARPDVLLDLPFSGNWYWLRTHSKQKVLTMVEKRGVDPLFFTRLILSTAVRMLS